MLTEEHHEAPAPRAEILPEQRRAGDDPDRVAKLYFGDNLGVLRDYIDDESVDLIYLDPPFNSNRNYNVLFADHDRREAPAQITAFEDTWKWDDTVERNYHELVGDVPSKTNVPPKLKELARALHAFLGENDMMAYLTMMGLRLVELHRVLRPTGSLYLHCDPTASHYLKIVLDAVFGPPQFRNEIAWQRSGAKNDSRRYGRSHDVLLFYTKSATFTWNPQHTPFSEETIRKNYTAIEPETGRRYRLSDLTAGKPGGDTDYEWHGVRPYKGRHWAFSREKMDEFYAQGRIVFRRTGMPVYKRYLDEMPGVPAQDVWTDIRLTSADKERIGYPTQKPVALLERIIAASSNAGDVVFDPFCGCGTSIEASQRLGRDWIGIDITHLAIKTIRERIAKVFGPLEYTVSGNPADADSARVLAEENPHQFQNWAVRFVGGRPPGGKAKKGKDRGIDGEFFFQSAVDKAPHRAVISVKGTKVVNPAMVRELRGTLEREHVHIGVLITAAPSTKEMRTEAAKAGQAPLAGKLYPRLQILTVDDLFAAKRIEHPGDNVTEGANPPPEQLLLFDQVKRGVVKSQAPQAAAPAKRRKSERP